MFNVSKIKSQRNHANGKRECCRPRIISFWRKYQIILHQNFKQNDRMGKKT